MDFISSLPVFEKLVVSLSQKNSLFDGVDSGFAQWVFPPFKEMTFRGNAYPFILTSPIYELSITRPWLAFGTTFTCSILLANKTMVRKIRREKQDRELWWEKFNSLKLDEKQYIHILSNKKQSPETKIGKGNWNPSTNLPSLDHLSLESNLKVFPWNHSGNSRAHPCFPWYGIYRWRAASEVNAIYAWKEIKISVFWRIIGGLLMGSLMIAKGSIRQRLWMKSPRFL